MIERAAAEGMTGREVAEGIGGKAAVGGMEGEEVAGGMDGRGVAGGRAAQRGRREMEEKNERAVKRGTALLQEKKSLNSFHQSR